LASLRIWLIL